MTPTIEKMRLEFPAMNPLSKVWIYQSETEFTDEQAAFLRAACSDFVGQWQAHGTELNADYRIFENRFVCFFVDETGQGATGCSIDKSLHLIQALEEKLGLSLLSRMEMAYLESGNQVSTIHLNGLEEALNQGQISEDSLVFNNLVANLGEMKEKWILPLRESWHYRFSGRN
jgi:hypothetical protein